MGGVVEDVQGGLGKFIGDEFASVLTTAALTAAAVYSGGAAVGALGLGGAAAGAGAGAAASSSLASAAHAAGMGAMTSGAGIASAASTGITSGVQTNMVKKQEAAQEEARQRAEAAERDAEIIRKRALLAEQTSTQGRTQAARTVKNNLQGLSRNTILGGSSERLGG